MAAELDRLDELAAKEIMGWHLGTPNSDFDELSDCAWQDANGPVYWDLGTAEVGSDNPWQPSRNIAQSWELLEKLASSGFSWSMWPINSGEILCEVFVVPVGPPFTKHTITAGSVPEAITRACLKAKGIE